MAKILIVYGTAYGQTERIAGEIARALKAAGHEVRVFKGDRLAPKLPLDEYDGIVVAASVLLGRHQRYIRAFVQDHLGWLNAAPSAFVSVCGALAGSEPNGSRMANDYVQQFLRATGWRPRIAISLAGGLAYTRYRPWVRWLMKIISRRTGRPTDTSRDYDFTDWQSVDRFASDFMNLLGRVPEVPAETIAQ